MILDSIAKCESEWTKFVMKCGYGWKKRKLLHRLLWSQRASIELNAIRLETNARNDLNALNDDLIWAESHFAPRISNFAALSCDVVAWPCHFHQKATFCSSILSKINRLLWSELRQSSLLTQTPSFGFSNDNKSGFPQINTHNLDNYHESIEIIFDANVPH